MSDSDDHPITSSPVKKRANRSCMCNWPDNECALLAEQEQMLNMTTFILPLKLNKSSVPHVAASVIFPHLTDCTFAYLNAHHFPPQCIDRDGSLMHWIDFNPELDTRGIVFSQPQMFQRLHNLGRVRLPSVSQTMFASAPTMTIDRLRNAIAARKSASGSGRKSHTPNSSTSSSTVRQELSQNLARAEIAKLSLESRNLITSDTNVAVNNATQTLEQRIRELEELNIKLGAEKETLQKQLQDERLKVTKVANLAEEEYWAKLSSRELSEITGLYSVKTMFGFLRAVAITFAEKKLDNDDSALGFDIEELQQFSKERATTATPSKKRHTIQSSSTPSVPIYAQILLTLISRRTAISDFVLGRLYGISRSKVQKINQRWIPRLGIIGEYLSSPTFSQFVVDFMNPKEFQQRDDLNVHGLVDCRDVPSATIRIDSLLRTMLFSSKLNASALRVLLMIHASGYPLVAAPAAFARGQEIDLVRVNSHMFHDVPEGAQIMGDRAYAYLSSYLPNHNQAVVPHFKNVETRILGESKNVEARILGENKNDRKKGVRQFSRSQLADSKDNARLRYTVETAFSRSKCTKRADGKVSRADMPNFNSTWYLSIGLSVFMQPLRQPHGNVRYETLADAYSAALRAEALCAEEDDEDEDDDDI